MSLAEIIYWIVSICWLANCIPVIVEMTNDFKRPYQRPYKNPSHIIGPT